MSIFSRDDALPPSSYDLDPARTGAVWLITGATNGIGRELARFVACPGRRLVLPARNLERAEAVAAELRSAGAEVDLVHMDLSSLDSVRQAARAVRELGVRIDVLVNNAGGVSPRKKKTEDGFEMLLGTNFLGPFAFTNQVADLVDGRIVITSSNTHKAGRFDLLDPHFDHRKWSWNSAYSQSKLADQMWAFGLQQRLSAAGSTVDVQTAHPGWSATNIQNTSGIAAIDTVLDTACKALAMSSKEGAMTLLEAAVGDHAPMSYIGPDGLLELWGRPEEQQTAPITRDAATTDKVWEFAVAATGTDLQL